MNIVHRKSERVTKMRMKLLVTAIIACLAIGIFAFEGVKETLADQLAMLHIESLSIGGSETDSDSPHGHVVGESQHDSEGEHHAKHKVLVTEPVMKDVTITERYVSQIRSRRHIEIRALEEGYLQDVNVNEGQMVHKGDLMFKIVPTLYQATLDADLAEAQLAQVEYDNTQKLVEQKIVSIQELKLAAAKLAKAKAQVERSQAELNFAEIKAPFDGIIDRLEEREGSLLEEGAMLTRLSDNDVMWVYFNVPEAQYFDYQEAMRQSPGHNQLDVELKLANHKLYPEHGSIGAIEAEFNNETGNIAFRADFPNSDGLLRHGQTGTILIHHQEEGALVIPQRATFEILAKTYIYVVDQDDVIHQREITIRHELDDIFLIKDGLQAGEKIVLEGLRQVHDGEHIEFEFVEAESVLTNLKYHAE